MNVHNTERLAANPFAAGGARQDEGEAPDDVRTFVTLELAGQWLAVDVAHVREILDWQEITPLPQAPSGIEGMIDVRGVAIAVVDLAAKLGMPPTDVTPDTRFLVFDLATAAEDGGETRRAIAVKADKVLEVSPIPDTEMEPAPEAGDGWNRVQIEGVTRSGDHLVVLVDIAAVFGVDAAHRDDIFDFS